MERGTGSGTCAAFRKDGDISPGDCVGDGQGVAAASDQNGADASGSDDSSGRAGTHFLSKYAAYPDSDPEDGRRGNAGYPEDSQSELEGAFPAGSDKVLPGIL